MRYRIVKAYDYEGVEWYDVERKRWYGWERAEEYSSLRDYQRAVERVHALAKKDSGPVVVQEFVL